MKIFRSIIILLLAVILYSCEAPRSNPLDPNSPDYQFCSLDGYVKTTTGQAIIGVKVTWRNQNIVTHTDTLGHYKFNAVPQKSGQIVFEMDGYYSDSTSVQITGTQKHIADEQLKEVTRIDGYVKTTTGQAIAGVKVTWRNQNIAVQTDINGYYKFNNIQMANGYVVFESDGYFKDSVNAQALGQQTKRLSDFSMYSIPKLTNIYLYTKVENGYPDGQEVYLIAQAQITDADKVVDSVFIRCTSINFIKKLLYNSSIPDFENTFLPSDFSTGSIDAVVGQTFEIVVKAKNRTSLVSIGSSYIKRVIREEAELQSPINKQIVSSPPTLIWYRFLPGYNFTYTVEIYKDTSSNSTPIWSKTKVALDAIQIVPNITLSPGEYYWVVWCIDDYMDETRSKKASFIIQ